jgi:hypothetical protein
MSAQPTPLPTPDNDPGPDEREFAYIPVIQLSIDPRIQRDVEPGEISMRINAEFEWKRFEVLTVVPIRGNGEFYAVIEGQHRYYAVRPFGPDFLVPCMIVRENSEDDSVPRIAYDISTGRRRHAPVDKLKLLHHSGDLYAGAIMSVLGARSLRPGSSRSARTISAVATMQDIVRLARRDPEEGAELLASTIDAIREAWPHDDPEHPGARWDGQILKAVANLISRNIHFEHGRLAAAISLRTAPAWVERNRDEQPWIVMGRNLVNLYNRNIRNNERRLQW